MAASDQGMFLQYCVFDGSISGNTEIQRRPYHRNCSCALHRSRGACSHSSLPNVTYPIRRTWSEGSLALSSSSLPNSSSYNNLANLSLSSSSSSSQIFDQ